MNDPIPQEAYILLSDLITTIGVGFGVWGVLNVLEGAGNDVPDARDLGEQQIKVGGNLVILAYYIREGTVPPPDIVEFMASR